MLCVRTAFSDITIEMVRARKARFAFALALSLLLLGGIAAAITIEMLVRSTRWVAHTYEVKSALGEVNSSLSSVSRARFDYIHSGDESFLSGYETYKSDVRA